MGGNAENAWYAEAAIEHQIDLPKDWAVKASATVGYVHPDDGPDGFSHYTLSLGAGYAFCYASVTYVGQIDKNVLPTIASNEIGTGYDVSVYGTVGVSIDF